MDAFLQQIFKDIIFKKNIYKDQKWQYEINAKLDYTYNHVDAQKLFEVLHNVSICNCENLLLSVPNFDIIIPINTMIYYEQINVLWFCYSTKLNIIMLCFTGTYCNILFLTDLNYKHQIPININNTKNGIKIHGGFLTLYSNIREKLLSILKEYMKDDTQLIITGYSLGGAISTLAALDLYKQYGNIIHYSFASPRLFNAIGALHFNSLNISSYRIQNGSDIVTSLPFPVMLDNAFEIQDFMHINSIQNFDMNLDNYYDNHVNAYLKYFDI